MLFGFTLFVSPNFILFQDAPDGNGGGEEDPGEEGEECLEDQIQDELFQEMLCELGVLEEEDTPEEAKAHPV